MTKSLTSFLIGSLPHKDVDEALDLAFAVDLPTLPNLPGIEEDEFMVDQALREIDGYTYKGHTLRPDGPDHKSALRFLAAEKFFSRLEGAYKWQACGPVTLASSLDHHPDTEEIIKKYFLKLAFTQKQFNKRSKDKSYFFLDEPVLGFNEASSGALGSFLRDLRSHEAFDETFFGLHSCSKVSLDSLAGLDFDLFALDPSLYSAEEWKEIRERLGSRLVYVCAGSKGEEIDYPIWKECYITAACGQALSSILECSKVLERILSKQ